MLFEVVIEIDAIDQAHVEVRLAVDLAVVMDRDDVRVAQAGGKLGLAQEPALEVEVAGQPGWEALERHAPRSLRVSTAR